MFKIPRSKLKKGGNFKIIFPVSYPIIYNPLSYICGAHVISMYIPDILISKAGSKPFSKYIALDLSDQLVPPA